MSDEIEGMMPTSGLLAWYEADGITGLSDGGSVTTVPDKSGNGRSLVCASSNPTYETGMINGYPAIQFSGSNNPLVYTGAVTPKHIFVVAAYQDAAFPVSGGAGEYAGLLSGIDTANNPILIGDPTTTKFFDTAYGANHTYKRRDVTFAEANMQAGMSGGISIYEVILTTGWSLDGIQFGKDRTFANRKWKGPLVGATFHNRVLSDAEVFDVYAYWAMKYWLWKRDAAGLNVFPFQPNWARPLNTTKRVLSSVSVSGAFKARTKTTKKIAVEPRFESRLQTEYDAAVAFWDEHFPGTTFIYRDDAIVPARDTEMRFLNEEFPQLAADYRDIDYGFQAIEV